MSASVISLISQKGGVGKSALARLIAVEYARAGWRVKLADLDTGQGSTARWGERRLNARITPVIDVDKYATVERAVRDGEVCDLLVLDGPAFAERRGLIMAQASDLIIMPACYGLDDLEPQVETANELEERGIENERILFVFCRAQASVAEEMAARSYLYRANMKVAGPMFPERASIRQAHNTGRAASEVSHRGLRTKILALTQRIVDALKQVSA